MSRRLYLVLLTGLVAFEVWAKFVAQNQLLTVLACVLGLGVIAVRYVTPLVDAECLPGCLKCAESESLEGEGVTE